MFYFKGCATLSVTPTKKDLKQELISGQGSITGGMVILF